MKSHYVRRSLCMPDLLAELPVSRREIQEGLDRAVRTRVSQ